MKLGDRRLPHVGRRVGTVGLRVTHTVEFSSQASRSRCHSRQRQAHSSLFSSPSRAMASSSSSPAVNSGDLVDLISSSGSATVYPSDDAILTVLQARFRADLPYTRINTSHLVAVNPYKALANTNDASAHEYEERSYKDTSLQLAGSSPPLPPHVYDVAARMYLLMRRRTESQAVIFRCVVLFWFLSCLAYS